MSDPLFRPQVIGDLSLPNRIVMAPMTRSRADQPGDVPSALMATYYAQRASAGLIISEATQISTQGQGYAFTPGIYSSAQIEGWRGVTRAVHAAKGRIFLQLWHVGRLSHGSFHADGWTVAPSAIAPGAQVWIAGEDGVVPVDCPTPRALAPAEITHIVEDYASAARNAIAAGFDGVEIHGANGYLIDQFLRRTSNTRTDIYGGSPENRTRFLLEVVDAVGQAIGFRRTGLRLAPFITQRGMDDPEIIDVTLAAAEALNQRGIAYLHLSEADGPDQPEVPTTFRQALRSAFRSPLIVAGGYDADRARTIISDGFADLVAFGRPFVANPDLPRRLAQQIPLATPDPSTFYSGGSCGYADYPEAEISMPVAAAIPEGENA